MSKTRASCFIRGFKRVSVKRRPDGGGWRRMADGGMADGGWRMADGGWRMADGGWRMIKCG